MTNKTIQETKDNAEILKFMFAEEIRRAKEKRYNTNMLKETCESLGIEVIQ